VIPAAKTTLSSTIAASVFMAALTGCGVHIRTQLLDRAFHRPAICPDAVTVFHDSSNVSKTHIVVARLVPPPGGAEYRPAAENVVEAQRKKAAALGANGLLVQEGVRHGGGLYDDALAVFIPEDSAVAFTVCSQAMH
jgi:hypothetical protein